MKSRFDNRCPHCGEQLEDLYTDWTGNDYQTEFRVECEHCGKPVAVTVHSVPEFELGPPICPMCNAELSLDDRHYCGPCAARLRELSEHNKALRTDGLGPECLPSSTGQSPKDGGVEVGLGSVAQRADKCGPDQRIDRVPQTVAGKAASGSECKV